MADAPILNLRDPDYRRNPYPMLARVRAENPVHQDDLGIWYVTRHADVATLLKDPRLGRDLRKWFGYQMLRPYLADSPMERCIEQWMFSVDPPEHTRLRQLVARAFTPKAVAAMRAAIEATADELLTELAARGEPELEVMTAFAQPFPVRVIARVLGLPITAYDDLKRWSTVAAVAIEPTARRREKQAASDAMVDIMAYLRTQVGTRRERHDGDVIGMLLAAEDGDRLTEEELISQLVLLFVAGHETTTNLIGNGLLALCHNPAQLERLRQDPALGATAVEEMLRFESPANTVGRVTHQDLTVGGVTIGAGQLVMCMAGGANRDGEVFVDPDRFDVGRSPNPHVSFGGGVHYCLGAPLARLEGQVAFERLLARLATVELAPDGVAWRDLVNVRGLERLRLRVTWRR
jgi:cytochrome P450